MKRQFASLLLCSLVSFLPLGVSAAGTLENSGFSTCGGKSDITVQNLKIKYNKDTNQIAFDVAGTSKRSQQVTVSLVFTAYGRQVYQREFDPCDSANKVDQLCPIPSGSFNATGTQTIPEEYAKMIPAIAFNVPDLDGLAKMEIRSKDTGNLEACIQSEVGNGKSMNTKAVPIIAAGIAAAALVVSALTSLASGGTGTSGPSPSFADIIIWFQSIAMNGMMSVDYPPMYRSFSRNFGFSGLLIPIEPFLKSIDDFRQKTGGNITQDSYEFLKNQAMFLYDAPPNGTLTKRAAAPHRLYARDETKTPHWVKGVQAFVEPLLIPKSDTFMTALLIFAIVIAAIIVGILLFKLILELFAMCGKITKGLDGFRKRYWWVIAKTITNLIFILYGVWTLYCVYQFTRGDSWAAKVLAGVTLGLFTAILAWFTWRIWSLARRYRKAEGSVAALYENKETWVNYSLFYENYKQNYWWVFIPYLVCLFARGVIIAAGDGHGMAQVIGHIILESCLLLLLIFLRPYTHKSSNWISILIQVVRLLSIICVLVFVSSLGFGDQPKAITGVVLVVMQAVLTGILAILIFVNGIIHCCAKNPHRKARKEAEKRKSETLQLISARGEGHDIEAAKRNMASTEYEVFRADAANQHQRTSFLPTASHPAYQPVNQYHN